MSGKSSVWGWGWGGWPDGALLGYCSVKMAERGPLSVTTYPVHVCICPARAVHLDVDAGGDAVRDVREGHLLRALEGEGHGQDA